MIRFNVGLKESTTTASASSFTLSLLNCAMQFTLLIDTPPHPSKSCQSLLVFIVLE